MSSLQGNKLAGGNPKNKRVENDFYATNPEAVFKLFENYNISEYFRQDNNIRFLEPCVEQGHIANTIEKIFKNQLSSTYLDIVNRGYKDTIVQNFLNYETEEKFDLIITNPPFSLAQEFIEKSLDLLDNNGKCCMFLKIQFLESVKRKDFFNKYPPKYIYVFRNRMATWNNGNSKDEKGNSWKTTMCHAWFIWENNYKGEPIVRWID